MKPCPYCPGIPKVNFQIDDVADYRVMCEGCGASSCPDGIRYTKEESIADWNTRIQSVSTELPTEDGDYYWKIPLHEWRLITVRDGSATDRDLHMFMGRPFKPGAWREIGQWIKIERPEV